VRSQRLLGTKSKRLRWRPPDARCGREVAEMVRRSGLSSGTFKRRFRAATDETTISYVQRISVERAKRALETGGAPNFQLPDLPHVRAMEPRAVAYQRTASSLQAAPPTPSPLGS
jgi:AraC-like DNA-binding protein